MVDTTTDATVAVLALLCNAAIKGDLAEADLVGLYQEPVPLGMLDRTQFPVLSIWVMSEKQVRESSTRLISEMTIAFDYIREPTGRTERDTRYPPLRHVWRSIRNVLLDGSYPTVSAGADVMGAAGLDAVEDGEAKRYGFIGEEAFPYFHAEMTIEEDPAAIDVNAIPDFLEHFTGFLKPGGAEYDPAIDDTTNLLGTEKVKATIAGKTTLSGKITG